MLNESISKARIAKGMTQRQLAEKVGVSVVTISRWECGHAFPNFKHLQLLAKLLKIMSWSV